ncbi:hypothetical protein RvVAR031_37940 [Agrobacterium vitis]|nr:hypothetical protein RvVAR031_37940 [Agrobacterium vitis]
MALNGDVTIQMASDNWLHVSTIRARKREAPQMRNAGGITTFQGKSDKS